MPYKTMSDLPDSIRRLLPRHAQEIYKESFNSALATYRSPEDRNDADETREEIAHKVAWGAVKRKYNKGEDGAWHLNDG